MQKINKYLSKVALKIIPYQWEDVPMGNLLRFDTNTLPFPPDHLTDFLQQMKTDCPVNEYVDPSYKKLKQLIADYEKVKPEMISVTNSGDEAIDILGKTFINPGDYFITTPPTYEMFAIQGNINKGCNLSIPLLGKDFLVDEVKIIQTSRGPRVRIIFLVNPNNPTASVIPQKTIEKIIRNSNSIVVVDEVYREFYGKTAVSLLKKYKNLVILRSFSKFAALAGARVGYLIADKELSEKFEAIRFPMGVSFFSYKLAEFVLTYDQQWIKEQVRMINSERKRLTSELTNLGFRVYPSYANYLLVRIGKKASDICQRLKRKKIIVRDRSNKRYRAGCVRITVRSREENDQLIKALKEIL
jgi:histidinol-phosphate aminotransferase